jgi:ribosomal protein S9
MEKEGGDWFFCRGGAWWNMMGERSKCDTSGKGHSLTRLFPTADVDIRVRVRGGGHTSQVYAIRQAIAKSIVCPHRAFASRLGRASAREKMLSPEMEDRVLMSPHRSRTTRSTSMSTPRTS